MPFSTCILRGLLNNQPSPTNPDQNKTKQNKPNKPNNPKQAAQQQFADCTACLVIPMEFI
jgi:hypothetical protein